MRRPVSPPIAYLLAALLVCPCLGCGYGETSRGCYDLATAIYSIANRRAATELELAEKLIHETAQAGDITAREQAWLQEMIDQARDGEWSETARAARGLMEAQAAK
jgi:hypothetical protein